MATATDLVMDLRLNYANLNRDIAGAKRVISNFAGGVGDLGGPARRFLAGIGAAVGLSVREFMKADHAVEGLRSALAANGYEVENNYKRMAAFSEQVRNSTVYSADFIKELQAMALNLGVSAKQTDEVVRAGIGLGKAFFGGDAQHGVKAAALAVQGNTGRLREMIPALRQVKGESAALNIVNQKATVGWREAQRDAKTFSGSLNSLTRSYHEAGAAIGSAFAPEVVKLAGIVDRVADKIKGMDDQQKKALVTNTEVGSSALLAVVGLSKLGTTTTGLRGVFGAATPAVGAFAFALASLGALYVNLTGKGDTFAERVADTWESIRKAAGKAIDWVGNRFEDVTNDMVRAYFQVRTLITGGDSEKMFTQYLQDQANQDVVNKSKRREAEKVAQAATASGDTGNVKDAPVDLKAEGTRKGKGSVLSLDAYGKKLQEAILNADSGDPLKDAANDLKDAAKDLKRAAQPGGGAATQPSQHPLAKIFQQANPLAKATAQETMAIRQYDALTAKREALVRERKAMTYSDEYGAEYVDSGARAKELDKQIQALDYQRAKAQQRRSAAVQEIQKIKGIDPKTAGMDPKKLAQNVMDDTKELAEVEKKLANLEGVDTPTAESTRRILEAKSRGLRGRIGRGGRSADVVPFDTDTTTPNMMVDKDRRAELGPFHGYRYERDADYEKLLAHVARDYPDMKKYIQTPDDVMGAQFGQSAETLKGLKDMGKAGPDMLEAAKNLKNARVVGVVKE